ncbi:hypothetical protein JEQ12_018535 [Ovis aries]|uniref:Uncharacterized protein n=1 Tax=Ovis aries TaxID=9940 RepID=A0A836D1T0_SHEEP|nr:hypothetical protein JEQ12_018535 [Ovis aries]
MQMLLGWEEHPSVLSEEREHTLPWKLPRNRRRGNRLARHLLRMLFLRIDHFFPPLWGDGLFFSVETSLTRIQHSCGWTETLHNIEDTLSALADFAASSGRWNIWVDEGKVTSEHLTGMDETCAVQDIVCTTVYFSPLLAAFAVNPQNVGDVSSTDQALEEPL